jgi:hypothetical protein
LTIIGNKATLLFVTLNISSEQFQKMKQFIYLVISVICMFAILDLIVRIYSIIHSRPSLRDRKQISDDEDMKKRMLEHPFDMPLEGKADIPLKSMIAKRAGNNIQQKKNKNKKKAKKNKNSKKNYNKVVENLRQRSQISEDAERNFFICNLCMFPVHTPTTNRNPKRKIDAG